MSYFDTWVKKQPELADGSSFCASNINCILLANDIGNWMIVMVKYYMQQPELDQLEMLNILDKSCSYDPKFYGVHILTFENTNPEDGHMLWDGEQISKARLLKILMFEDEDISSCMQC